MAFETAYPNLRENLAGVLDRVAADREVVLVRRKGQRDVALVPAGKLAGLMETSHLLRSPRNARRLLTPLHRAVRRQGQAKSVERLGREIGLEAR